MKLKIKDLNKDKVFFTSDTHFFHTNILAYCQRPFKDVSEMNESLIKNWNDTVPVDGVVFHLGDVALTAGKKEMNELVSRLNGTIHLIVGNHERCALDNENIRKRWSSISDICEIEVEDEEITYGKQHIVLCHYPMVVFNGSHRGSWQLFGHVHGALNGTGRHTSAQMDVGVDCHNFCPVSYQQVKEQLTKQMLGGAKGV